MKRQEYQIYRHLFSIYSKFLPLVAIIIFLLFFTTTTYAADVTLAWDSNTASNIAGYKIHYGLESGNYSTVIDVDPDSTTYLATGLNEGTTYYFAATVYDSSNNESGFSKELVYTVPSSSSTTTTTSTTTTEEPATTTTTTSTSATTTTVDPTTTATTTTEEPSWWNWLFPTTTTEAPATTTTTTSTSTTTEAPTTTTTTTTEAPTATEEQNELTLEVGEKRIDDQWVRIDLDYSYVDPVVVANPVSLNDKDPAVVRIRNIDSTGFEIRLQEWDYLDGTHAPETVTYMVIEKGSYVLEDGTRLEAGSFLTQKTSSYEEVYFEQPFHDVPVVIASIASYEEQDAVTGRIRRINTEGFEYRMQEQELNLKSHVTEEISFIAWEPSSGTINDIVYEVGKTGDEITHNLQTITFEQEFQKNPFFLADIQTRDGGDTANVRWQNKDAYAIDVLIAEEQSSDNEISHITEVVGYCVFERVSMELAGEDTTPLPQDSSMVVTIISPAGGSTFTSGDRITFEGSAIDNEDDVLSDNLVWSSSIDGQIGTKGSFSTTLSEGDHTITASVTDADGQEINISINITVEMDQSSDTSTVHIGDLGGDSSKSRWFRWKATVTIEIHDDNCDPVDGATVSGNWTGGYSGSGSCITQDGICSVTSGNISFRNKQTEFTVENIVAPVLTYKPVDNHGLGGDSDGTSISVSRP